MGKTAISLPGGGSKGITALGYLKAFRDAGLDYDEMYTSSVGTLNGTLYHSNELDKLEDLWLNLRTEDVYRHGIFTNIFQLAFKKSLYNSAPLKELIKKNVNYEKLIANPRKLFINTTNFTTRQPLVREVKTLSKTELIDFAHASASPPVYFELVKFQGNLLGDSAVSNDYSIVQAAKSGCDVIYVLSPSPEGLLDRSKDPETLLEVLGDTLDIATGNYFAREKGCIEKINALIDIINISLEPDFRKIKFVVISPDKDPGIELLDFNYKQDRRVMIREAYEYAKDILKNDSDQG